MDLTTEQAWRLLTNNLPAEGRRNLSASGDERVVEALLHARAIIGLPTWSAPVGDPPSA